MHKDSHCISEVQRTARIQNAGILDIPCVPCKKWIPLLQDVYIPFLTTYHGIGRGLRDEPFRPVFVFAWLLFPRLKIEAETSTANTCTMKLRSLLYCDSITEEDLLRHEHSDRIWLPRHMFERWLSEEEVGTIVTAKLEDIAVCMYGHHEGPPDTLYAPTWICIALGAGEETEDDYIVPIRFKPEMCTFLSLQPHTSHHLKTAMEPEECLAIGMEQYTCIQKGQTLSLRLVSGEVQEVTVVDVFPETEEPVCIRNPVGDLELSLELLPPLDAPIPLPPVDPPVDPPMNPPADPAPTPEGGHVLDAHARVLTREELREQRCRMLSAKK